MGLMCVDQNKVSMIVTCYFLAYGFAGLFLFPLPDKLGCKKTMAVFAALHLFSQFIIIFVPVYTVRLVGFAMMGFCQLKNSVSYVWLFDLVETKHKSIVCGIMNSFDNITMTVLCLYFKFVSRHWTYLFYLLETLGVLSYIVLMLCVPDSPKWLLLNGRKKEAIAAFNYMAIVNRCPERIPEDANFVESNFTKNHLQLSVNQSIIGLIGEVRNKKYPKNIHTISSALVVTILTVISSL